MDPGLIVVGWIVIGSMDPGWIVIGWIAMISIVINKAKARADQAGAHARIGGDIGQIGQRGGRAQNNMIVASGKAVGGVGRTGDGDHTGTALGGGAGRHYRRARHFPRCQNKKMAAAVFMVVPGGRGHVPQIRMIGDDGGFFVVRNRRWYTDIGHQYGSGQGFAGIEEVPRFFPKKRDAGARGKGDGAPVSAIAALAAIAIDAAWNIDGQNIGAKGLKILNGGGDHPIGRRAQSTAENGIDDKGRVMDGGMGGGMGRIMAGKGRVMDGGMGRIMGGMGCLAWPIGRGRGNALGKGANDPALIGEIFGFSRRRAP